MTDSPGITEWRRERRGELLARRMALSADQHHQCNVAITALVLEGFPMLRGSVVGFYWPFKGEFDPRFAIHELRRSGARAALPVVLQRNAALQFREWWPGVATVKGVFDLPIPDGTRIVLPDALLIPPIGFDRQAYRLGYGGGYFDRTLAAMAPRPLTIGVGFELSRMATIRPQPHDIALDFIVTEAGIHHVGPNGLEPVCDLSRVSDLVRGIAAPKSASP